MSIYIILLCTLISCNLEIKNGDDYTQNRNLELIRIEKYPKHLIYNEGQPLDINDMEINAIYKDLGGSILYGDNNILDKNEYSISPYDPYALGIQELTITYKDKTVTLKVFVDKNNNILKYIEGGSFVMGDNTDRHSRVSTKPARQVLLNNFYLSETEVNYYLWYNIKMIMDQVVWFDANKFTFSHADEAKDGRDEVNGSYSSLYAKQNAAHNIRWNDAIIWLNAYSLYSGLEPVYLMEDGTIFRYTVYNEYDSRNPIRKGPINNVLANGYRLPTEAEWEYAAGGGKNNRTLYAGTNDIEELVNYANFSNILYISLGYMTVDLNGISLRTKQKLPNNLGLYDMNGNVWEYCFDWMADYNSINTNNPVGPTSGQSKIIRGGSIDLDIKVDTLFNQHTVNYETLLVIIRGYLEPSYNQNYIGFRIAKNNDQ